MEQIWFHIDVNSAFLSWTAAYRVNLLGETEDLRDMPSVIGGNEKNRHGIVLAKSLSAKAYKIKTGESLMEARKKCPNLMVIPPDYELYVRNSRAMIQMLRSYTPHVIQYSIDECFADMTGTETLWGSPLIAANAIRNRIRQELGFTVNIGISTNKLLAKMASDFRKPDRCHTLFPWEMADKMWPLPIEDLFFAGRASSSKLHRLGIHTIGQLAATDANLLKSHLKHQGTVLHQYANGIDSAPYLTIPVENKGYGNSITVPSDITDLPYAHAVLLSLCETIGTRLRLDQVKVSAISISFVNSDFEHWSHQSTLSLNTDSTWDLYCQAVRIFNECWNRSPLRQLGVHTFKVQKENFYQMDLFHTREYEKNIALEHAIDSIRQRYGENAMIRARFLTGPINHMSGGLDPAKRQGITKPISLDSVHD